MNPWDLHQTSKCKKKRSFSVHFEIFRVRRNRSKRFSMEANVRTVHQLREECKKETTEFTHTAYTHVHIHRQACVCVFCECVRITLLFLTYLFHVCRLYVFFYGVEFIPWILYVLSSRRSSLRLFFLFLFVVAVVGLLHHCQFIACANIQ